MRPQASGRIEMITDEKGFNVVCTNPAKSAAIEACWFSYADWTEEDAMNQFATDYALELSEVAVEKED
jgi:hypothetical protein